jgi:glycosyltransferase involved in cell wall biosynthesis
VIVSIHQPNYLPWLGYFAKLARSDVFVFLDHVPLSKGSYTPRVQILGQGRPQWLSIPIRTAGQFGHGIDQTAFDDRVDWRRKHLRTLQLNYGKHPHFEPVFGAVQALLAPPAASLAQLNERGVVGIAQALGITCRFLRSSELDVSGFRSSELLAAVVLRAGGTRYLHGAGAASYQDAEVFRDRRVELVAQEFSHPSYPQAGSEVFVPGLSVLDALFNVGFAGVAALLQTAATDVETRGRSGTHPGASSTLARTDPLEPGREGHAAAELRGAVPRPPPRPLSILTMAQGHSILDERVLRTVQVAARHGRSHYAVDARFLHRLRRDGEGAMESVLQRLGTAVELVLLPPRSERRLIGRVTRQVHAMRSGLLARRLRPDVVHIHESGFLGLLTAHWVRRFHPSCTIIFDYHDWIPFEIAASVRNRARLFQRLLPPMLRLHRYLARSVDAAVCISEGQAEWTREVLGIRKTSVVQNVRPRIAQPDLAARDFAPQLLFLGHVMRGRRLEVFVDALVDLSGRGVHATLEVFGEVLDPGYAEEVRQYAHARGAGERLTFHGRYSGDESVAPFLHRGALGTFLSPEQVIDTGALRIASTNKFFSYLALGVPVLLPAGHDNMCEILRRYGAGEVFSSLDDLVQRAERIWRTPGAWEHLSAGSARAGAEVNSTASESVIGQLYAGAEARHGPADAPDG